MHPLDGVRLKIARADQQLEVLKGEFDAFQRRHPYAIRGEYEPDTSEYVFRIKIFERPPGDWGALIGEVAHDLRSSLDHLVWQLVLLNGKKPTRSNQWPIFRDPDEFRDRGKAMLKGIRADHAAMIKRVQPYERFKDSPNADPLWVLNEINRVDKHQVLHTTIHAPLLMRYGLAPIQDVEDRFGQVIPVGEPFEDNAEVLRVGVFPTGPNPKVSMDVNLRTVVKFDHAELANVDVGPTLETALFDCAGHLHVFVSEFP